MKQIIGGLKRMSELSLYIIKHGLGICALIALISLVILISSISPVYIDYIKLNFALLLVEMSVLSIMIVVCGALLIDLYEKSHGK